MKEQNELKVVLNIFQKFLELNKCKKVTFDIDGYDLNMQDDRFLCSGLHRGPGQRLRPPIPISQFIENFMEALDSSGDLERYSEDGDQEIYNYEFVIDSENKQVSILGNYSVYKVEETQMTELYAKDMDDEEFSNFFKKLREEGDFELEVQFEGGGDSGWIHDTGETRKTDNYPVPPFMVETMYQMLEDYPGWEINEGSQGEFTFESAGGKDRLTLYMNMNTEETAEELVYQFNY
jgi:hypothetical protein